MAAVIETERLTKSYGEHRGVVELDLAVEQGEIFGFLGPNGAGKTTTMRVLLDLIRPTSGRATVFGIETTADPVAIHKRVGYLPGEFDLYDRLTGAQTIQYFGNLRGGIDRAYVASLIERLDLDPSRRFKEYSKGNKQKVGLVVALQHKPDLLILDEPTSGLDPLIQQTFFGLVREAREEGRTIFLSSHIIDEVDRTCDRVAIIREGRLVQVDRIEAIRRLSFHHVELMFPGPVAPALFEGLPGVSDVAAEGDRVTMRVSGPIGQVIAVAAAHGIVDVVSREPNLEDVFLAQYGGTSGVAGVMTTQPLTLSRPGPLSRVFGLGSVYGKTLARQLAGGAGHRRRRGAVHVRDRRAVRGRAGVLDRGAQASIRQRSPRAPTGAPRTSRRTDPPRDDGWLPVLARRQLPAGHARAVAGHRAVRDARGRGRQGQSGPSGIDAARAHDDRHREARRARDRGDRVDAPPGCRDLGCRGGIRIAAR